MCDPFQEYVELCAAQGLDFDTRDIDIGSTDALIIVDMQNDFVPVDAINPDGGKFGVSGGANAANVIVELIQEFSEKHGVIVGTRDYHPCDHASFAGLSKGAWFPPHCIQGSEGTKFYKPIGDALASAREEYGPDKVQIAFKGFHEDIDSFGSFTYSEEYTQGRYGFQVREAALSSVQQCMGCELMPWTGSFVLKQSNLQGGEQDINAPPDVLAALHSKVTLKDALVQAGVKRIFCVGLALDFCVLDTALNASESGFDEVYFVFDAARAAHVPGLGKFGSGFLQDPAWVLGKLKEKAVPVIRAETLLGRTVDATRVPHTPRPKASFPEVLNEIGLVRVPLEKFNQNIAFGCARVGMSGSVRAKRSVAFAQGDQVRITKEGSQMTKLAVVVNANFHSGLICKVRMIDSGIVKSFRPSELERVGGDDEASGHTGEKDAEVATCSFDFHSLGLHFLYTLGVQQVTLSSESKKAAGIDAAATSFQWVFPVPGVEKIQEVTLGYFAQSDPIMSFLLKGGFLYFDENSELLQACAVKLDSENGGLTFESPEHFPLELIPPLKEQGRLQPVTSEVLQNAGCTHFAWLLPQETIVAGADSCIAPDNGAFLYCFAPETGELPRCFGVAEMCIKKTFQ